MTERILLAHGSGGQTSHQLIARHLLGRFRNQWLDKMDDSAVIQAEGRLAFTTDSYVITPYFFPGGDIGKLAICGTVNDLSVMGACPRFINLALILEEGLPVSELETILDSIQSTASQAGVDIVTGDTKVVQHGGVDGIFINTSGIGWIEPGSDISGSKAMPGDTIIINGSIGDHGLAVLSQREGLEFQAELYSDCAPLNSLVAEILSVCPEVHAMRDPTRGGLATSLNEIASRSEVGILIQEEAIPVKPAVVALCDILGLDPLYVANEGKIVLFVPEEKAENVVEKMRCHPYGRDAAIIGTATKDNPGRVSMQTRLDTNRIINMLSGDILPRIC